MNKNKIIDAVQSKQVDIKQFKKHRLDKCPLCDSAKIIEYKNRRGLIDIKCLKCQQIYPKAAAVLTKVVLCPVCSNLLIKVGKEKKQGPFNFRFFKCNHKGCDAAIKGITFRSDVLLETYTDRIMLELMKRETIVIKEVSKPKKDNQENEL